MKLRKTLFCLAILILMTTSIFAANTNPVVTNVTFSISGTTVTVHYDVTDAEQSTLTISMEVSSNGGTTWDFNYGTANGDIGNNIAIGTGKTITWTYSGDYNNQFQIRIIANDLVIDGGPCADATVLYSGQTYHTVQIGLQCWLKENLNVGTMILQSVDQTDNGTIEKYCYANDPNNCSIYGGLYKWSEAMGYSTVAGTKGICPTGWHIPTLTEFTTLQGEVGNDAHVLESTDINTSGFSALFGGYSYYTVGGGFDVLTYHAYFWSSTENDISDAYFLRLISDIYIYYNYKDYGFSIRCLKD